MFDARLRRFQLVVSRLGKGRGLFHLGCKGNISRYIPFGADHFGAAVGVVICNGPRTDVADFTGRQQKPIFGGIVT